MAGEHNFARGGETLELRGDAPADLVRLIGEVVQTCPDEFNQFALDAAKRHGNPVSVRVSKLVEAMLAPQVCRRVTLEGAIEDVLEQWAKDQASKQSRVIFALRAVSTTGIRKVRQPEKEVERILVKALIKAGIRGVKAQVQCADGTADIVTDTAVIEVKATMSNRRDANRAMGQALAYAKSLDKRMAIVCAPELPAGMEPGALGHGHVLACSVVPKFLIDAEAK